MKLIKPDFPPEVLAYKERHIGPLKSEHDQLTRRGNVAQIEVRAQLIPALEKYLEFLSGFNGDHLNSEMAWAERELAELVRMEERNMIKVPVRRAGRPIHEQES